MGHALQLLIYGLQLGSLYALLAIGYTLVFGIIKMINLAHADLMMLGAFIAYYLFLWFAGGENSVITVVFIVVGSMLLVALIGFVIERVAYNPLRGRTTVASLVAAIGVQLFIENLMRCLPGVGALPKNFPTLFPKTNIVVGGYQITSTQIIVIVIAVILLLFMQWLCYHTSLGKQMQAVSVDKDASALMGINVNKVISITFSIGAALAAICGILYGSLYPTIYVYMAGTIGNKAFISAVIGGIGNIKGAMLGGLIIGIMEVFLQSFAADISYGLCFVILILVLLYKPTGLLGGKAVREKV